MIQLQMYPYMIVFKYKWQDKDIFTATKCYVQVGTHVRNLLSCDNHINPYCCRP